MNIGLQVLRAKIRGFQAASISINKRIHKSSGQHRHRLRCEKRMLGDYYRDHLIAYCLLRNVQYEKIEKCSKANKPNINRIFELIKMHGRSLNHTFTIEKLTNVLHNDRHEMTPEKMVVQ